MVTSRKLANLSKKILVILKRDDVTLDIVLLPHADMATMKRRFFKKYSEPNVISFPHDPKFPSPGTKKRYLGEIYLNRDILARQPERTAHLLTHGILHLLGHDHKKKLAAAKMERLEARVLRAIDEK